MLDHPLISHTDVQKLSEIQHSGTPLLVVLSFVLDEGALAFEELLTSVISASCVLLAGALDIHHGYFFIRRSTTSWNPSKPSVAGT
jgi:hypothetical protein